jgi:hypothetical protein
VTQRLSERIQAYANKSFKGYSTIPYSLIREVEALEVENKTIREQMASCNNDNMQFEKRNLVLEATLERVKKLVAEEWDSSTCIVDSEKIEEYEHCTCAEDYANVFVQRLKVLLG